MCTKVILIAGGEATRWRNYLGVTKHFVQVEGESILARSVRLFSAGGEVYVTAPRGDARYHMCGAATYPIVIDPRNWDADKFWNTQGLWNTKGRTIIVFGDVFFTEGAVEAILKSKKRAWTVFGRFGGGVSGNHAEFFAISFYPFDIERFRKTLLGFIRTMDRAGVNLRACGLAMYQLMCGSDRIDRLEDLGNRVEIDDLTNDFDTPEDYRRWKKAYDRHS